MVLRMDVQVTQGLWPGLQWIKDNPCVVARNTERLFPVLDNNRNVSQGAELLHFADLTREANKSSELRSGGDALMTTDNVQMAQ